MPGKLVVSVGGSKLHRATVIKYYQGLPKAHKQTCKRSALGQYRQAMSKSMWNLNGCIILQEFLLFLSYFMAF